MGRFMNGEAAVADEHDITPWQPAAKLEDALPGPVGQQPVPAPPLAVGPLGGRKQGRHGQRLGGPAQGRGVSTMKLNQRKPPAFTKWPWLERTGSRQMPRAVIPGPHRRSMVSSIPITTGPVGTRRSTIIPGTRRATARASRRARLRTW